MSRQSTLSWSSASRTHAGTVRKENEDACLARADRYLWVVADGMGGHADGARASRSVIEALDTIDSEGSLSDSLDAVRSRLNGINKRLRQEAMHQGGRVVGSTVVAFIARDRHCIYLWAGDSRAYLYRDETLLQLTRDHTRLEELVAQGVLDRQEAQNSVPKNVITRAVGAVEPLELDTELIEAQDGDIYLLCSDGLTNEVSDEEICKILSGGHCEYAADALLELALSRGARDNVTLIVIRAEDADHPTRTVFNPQSVPPGDG